MRQHPANCRRTLDFSVVGCVLVVYQLETVFSSVLMIQQSDWHSSENQFQIRGNTRSRRIVYCVQDISNSSQHIHIQFADRLIAESEYLFKSLQRITRIRVFLRYHAEFNMMKGYFVSSQ